MQQTKRRHNAVDNNARHLRKNRKAAESTTITITSTCQPGRLWPARVLRRLRREGFSTYWICIPITRTNQRRGRSVPFFEANDIMWFVSYSVQNLEKTLFSVVCFKNKPNGLLKRHVFISLHDLNVAAEWAFNLYSTEVATAATQTTKLAWTMNIMRQVQRIWAEVPSRDGNGSSFMTHDPWPLHHFILRKGLGGAWNNEYWNNGTGQWTTLSILKAKDRRLSPQL